ncbi:MAG: V-type ATP synthase subunit E family protein [Candidatus Neomarinimicrobiota bacterium]|jgi:V/A-type H+-transporting ATPase subunit E|nr:V-type ATP synthase subunit E family protein [Candidatus Neomarinimicrobiota bacterium]MDD3966488.1 V-type ATP synthase subunit E family protein [Candidatus Neomarinimicrobiota bacterium]MDX9780795.1 V-type ATP synthase subunit E family protein [bacterium]
MNVKLDSLIEKIKSDGVDAAKKQADTILADTRKTANGIISEAKAEAEKVRKKAEADAESYRRNAETAIKQAARDTVLTLKEKIGEMFEQVLLADIGKTLNKDLLRELILKLAELWSKEGDLDVIVNAADADALKAQLKRSLSGNLKGELDLRIDKKIEHGFRIGKKGEDLYYDFTDESILEALRIFLNPKLAELLK